MAVSPECPPSPTSFSDFPEDVQLTILSFLRPPDVAAFACTSRRFAFLCAQNGLWFAMCDRRWGTKALIRSWAASAGCNSTPFALLYRVLDRWENLIGFWRRIGRGGAGTPSLVFFEWGNSSITGSIISPSPAAGSYGVLKMPYLWMGISPSGEPVGFVRPACRLYSTGNFVQSLSNSSPSDWDLIPVTVGFMGENHFVVEENRSYYVDLRGAAGDEEWSPAEGLMSEIFEYFASGTGPVGEKFLRKQMWKRERIHSGRRRWEAEHFVKIADCYPTPERPLQGLWKGICENMRLAFFLVTYDNMGGIACRKAGDASEPFASYLPVFWTSDKALLQYPLTREEQVIYNSREHIGSTTFHCTGRDRVVSRILCINSSYDLVIPDSSGSFVNSQNVEGRIYVYDTGTFGFGFLRNKYIVDLQHIALNGLLLDAL